MTTYQFYGADGTDVGGNCTTSDTVPLSVTVSPPLETLYHCCHCTSLKGRLLQTGRGHCPHTRLVQLGKECVGALPSTLLLRSFFTTAMLDGPSSTSSSPLSPSPPSNYLNTLLPHQSLHLLSSGSSSPSSFTIHCLARTPSNFS